MRKTTLLKTFLMLCALVAVVSNAWAGKITDYTNIVSGTQYYIGATTSGTDYYLSVDGSSTSTSIAGTAVTSKANATVFTFEGSETSWTIQLESGFYLSLKNGKDNGKVQVVENAATFTASNQSQKIRLTIGNYSIQKNNSGTQFGSYANTQTDLWLEVATPSYSITALSNNNSYGTVSLSGTTITATPATGYRVSITTPYTVNSGTATVTQNGNTFEVSASTDCTVTINFEAKPTVSGYTVDFESDATEYSDWTFTNIVSNYKNTDIATHGGLKYGHTGGKGTGSIQTKEKVNPASLTCYVSKQSDNTTASTWYVQVSSDGSNWKNAGSTSAIDMAKGEWKEFTVDLSNYSDVYVRVYYSGSTAYRLIDDLTLVFQDSDTPFISADNVELEYDATTGFISYTINNVEGGTLTAATTANWLTLGTVGETVPFTCSANTEAAERTATVTLTYTYGDNETLTKEVIVTQAAAPVIYTTIPEIFDAATTTATDVNVTFNNWVVSGVKNSNVYVTDNNGNGFIIYTSNHGFAVNNKLSGTVSGTPLKLYNGSAEFTNLTASTTGLTVTNDGTITVVTDKTIADLGGVNTGAVITLNNLTYDGTNLSDGTNTIKPYNLLYSDMSFTSGKTYNVTGVYVQYGNTKEIAPRSAEDIEEVAVQHEQYTLTVSNLVHVETYVFAGDESEPLFESEGSAQIYDATEVMIRIDAEEGYVLQSLMVDGVEHKADIDGGMYIFLMPTNNVTVTATAVEAATYTLATSITSGKHYVIAATTSTTTKAMGGKNASKAYYDAVDASLSGNTLAVIDNAVQEFVIYGPYADGFYTIYDPVAEGYLYASSSSSNDLNYQETNDNNGLWEIDFENETVTAQGSHTRNMLRYNSSNPRFSCYASGQTAIQFYEKDGEATPTESRTLNELGYATYCSQNALDFTDAEGVTAWAITGVNGENITFSQIPGKVPAGTGMLLKGAANASVTMTSAAGAVAALNGNLLEGTLVSKTITAGQYYGLSGNTFVPVLAGTVPAGKALLPVSAAPESSRLTFVFEDATGIASIENGMLTNDRYYNLSGQRVDSPKKGLYIVNGKKVVVK